MPLPGDEGDLIFKIEIKQDGDHEDLVIDFGKPTAWIGFHKSDVKKLIKILQEKMNEMKDEPPIKPRFNLN